MTDNPKNLTLPAINLNGSSPDVLVEGLREAVVALSAAIDAVAKTAPHGRDYQTLDDTALPAAQHEHAERMASLHGVKAELEQIAIAILDRSP